MKAKEAKRLVNLVDALKESEYPWRGAHIEVTGDILTIDGMFSIELLKKILKEDNVQENKRQAACQS